MSSSFGHCFRVTTFGESHGVGLGVTIDGCPGGVPIDLDRIRHQLLRRKPGAPLTSPRNEPDRLECLSGLQEGKTLGTPICFVVYNTDARPDDYGNYRHHYRNSHADFSTHQKYGVYARSGGGRASARETLSRVIAGSVAHQLLSHAIAHYQVVAFVNRVGDITMPTESYLMGLDFSQQEVDAQAIRCPNPAIAEKMANYIKKLRAAGDTTGGQITCVVEGVPAGLGEPVFDKLNADLAKAMMSLPASRTFSQGLGEQSTRLSGSQNNDPMDICPDSQAIIHTSNRTGGIEGGISNGSPIFFQVAFKAPSSLFQPQKSVTHQGKSVTYAGKGRHDPCVLPRAVPIVEAMTSMVLADHFLRQKMFSWTFK